MLWYSLFKILNASHWSKWAFCVLPIVFTQKLNICIHTTVAWYRTQTHNVVYTFLSFVLFCFGLIPAYFIVMVVFVQSLNSIHRLRLLASISDWDRYWLIFKPWYFSFAWDGNNSGIVWNFIFIWLYSMWFDISTFQLDKRLKQWKDSVKRILYWTTEKKCSIIHSEFWYTISRSEDMNYWYSIYGTLFTLKQSMPALL